MHLGHRVRHRILEREAVLRRVEVRDDRPERGELRPRHADLDAAAHLTRLLCAERGRRREQQEEREGDVRRPHAQKLSRRSTAKKSPGPAASSISSVTPCTSVTLWRVYSVRSVSRLVRRQPSTSEYASSALML